MHWSVCLSDGIKDNCVCDCWLVHYVWIDIYMNWIIWTSLWSSPQRRRRLQLKSLGSSSSWRWRFSLVTRRRRCWRLGTASSTGSTGGITTTAGCCIIIVQRLWRWCNYRSVKLQWRWEHVKVEMVVSLTQKRRACPARRREAIWRPSLAHSRTCRPATKLKAPVATVKVGRRRQQLIHIFTRERCTQWCLLTIIIWQQWGSAERIARTRWCVGHEVARRWWRRQKQCTPVGTTIWSSQWARRHGACRHGASCNVSAL